MKTVFPMEKCNLPFDLEEIGFVEVHVTEEKNAGR